MTTKQKFCTALASATALAAALFTASEAGAVSAKVKIACTSDYFAYCSKHPVGSERLRQCMRDAGPRLSKRCLNALIAEGEVSEEEVHRRAASLDD